MSVVCGASSKEQLNSRLKLGADDPMELLVLGKELGSDCRSLWGWALPVQ